MVFAGYPARIDTLEGLPELGFTEVFGFKGHGFQTGNERYKELGEFDF